jgi:hypothetical protein
MASAQINQCNCALHTEHVREPDVECHDADLMRFASTGERRIDKRLLDSQGISMSNAHAVVATYLQPTAKFRIVAPRSEVHVVREI